MHKKFKSLRGRIQKAQRYSSFTALVVIVALVGVYLFENSHAASPYISSEAESSHLGSGASLKVDTTGVASGGAYVQFGTALNPCSGAVTVNYPVATGILNLLYSLYPFHRDGLGRRRCQDLQ